MTLSWIFVSIMICVWLGLRQLKKQQERVVAREIIDHHDQMEKEHGKDWFAENRKALHGEDWQAKTYCGSEEAFLKLSDKKKEKVRKEAAEFFRQVGIRNEKFRRKYR